MSMLIHAFLFGGIGLLYGVLVGCYAVDSLYGIIIFMSSYLFSAFIILTIVKIVGRKIR